MNVNDGPNFRVLVEGSSGDDYVCSLIFEYRHVGATHATEGTKVLWRGLVVLNEGLAGQPAE